MLNDVVLVSAVLCLVTQLCMSLCDPMDCNPQAPLSMGILQTRILEWVAMPSSREFPLYNCATTQISVKYTYNASLLSLLPNPPPFHPTREPS